MNQCNHKDQPTWWLLDAQGIEVGLVCDLCESAVKAKYRPEIFTGYTQADVDEPIEPEIDNPNYPQAYQ